MTDLPDRHPQDVVANAWAQIGAASAPSSHIDVAGLRLSVARVADDGRLVIVAHDAAGAELHRDSLNPDSAQSRKRFAKAVAEATNLNDDDKSQVERALLQCKAPPETPPDPSWKDPECDAGAALTRRDEASAEALAAMPKEVVLEAEEMLRDPRLFDRVLADIESVGVVGETILAGTVYVLATSRLLPRPLAGLVQGTSSSGKSFTIERTGSLFPDEEVLWATDITPNALYYLPFGDLMHRCVFSGERSRAEDDDQAEAKRALREMIAAGSLRKMIPVKNPEGGFTTKTLYAPGPIAFIESTTNTNVFDEDANRCLMLSTDESPEQTARVVRAMAAAAARESVDTSPVRLRHNALQRLLKRVEVRVPFAARLADAMPTQRPEARRAIGQVLSVIRAVAVLYQRQRSTVPLEHGAAIDATTLDYAIARRLLSGPLGRSLGGSLPASVARFGERLIARFDMDEFSSTDALAADPILRCKSKINQYLRTLADAGVVVCTEETRGSKPSRWKVSGEPPEPGAAWLPTIADLEGDEP